MGKYLLLSLFLMVSCGKDVNISTKMLETNANSSSASNLTAYQDGLLIRGPKDQIRTNSTVYYVSIYSSYSALEFIAARPLNSQLPVRFKEVKSKNNREIVLQVIEAK